MLLLLNSTWERKFKKRGVSFSESTWANLSLPPFKLYQTLQFSLLPTMKTEKGVKMFIPFAKKRLPFSEYESALELSDETDRWLPGLNMFKFRIIVFPHCP